MSSVTVPLRGDKSYKDAFAALARKNNMTMAEMVRQALDKVYGEHIAKARLFFAEDGQVIVHMEDNKSAHLTSD